VVRDGEGGGGAVLVTECGKLEVVVLCRGVRSVDSGLSDACVLWLYVDSSEILISNREAWL